MEGTGSRINPHGLNLLALDGGGLAGLSSLYILQEIMSRLQERDKLDTRPEPREYFDMIAGTGTGAICAVMLGRLNMSLDDVIEKFSHLAPTSVSREKRMVHRDAWDIKPSELEEWLRTTVQESTGNADETMLDGNLHEAKCKVVVYAISTHNLHDPCAFRTYPTNGNVMPDWPIRVVLRASMAHDDLFPGTSIRAAGTDCRFTSAFNARSNPTREILQEAYAHFPGHSVTSLVSIGVGQAHTFGIPQSNPLVRMFAGESPEGVRLLQILSDIATSNERAAEEEAKNLSELAGVYHRLNMDRGTQKIRPSALEFRSEAAANTRSYVREKEISERLEQVVASVRRLNSTIASPSILNGLNLFKLYYPPYPTSRFRGRKQQLERASEYFESDRSQHVLIIDGVSGVGKTQIALKCVEIVVKRFECAIFIDGSSSETIKTALRQLATIVGMGAEHTDFLEWIGDRRERWLVLFDDVDDPDALLDEYFARINKYDIIITTRQPRSSTTSLDCDGCLTCEITPMNTEEALGMLLDISGLRMDRLGAIEAELTILLHELKHLALAIALLYIQERQKIVTAFEDNGLKQGDLGDYNPTHTVCSLTVRHLDAFSDVGRLWKLVVPLYRNTISERLFRRAYEGAKYYRPAIPMTHSEKATFQYVKTVLNLLGTNQGLWSNQKFHSMMSQLLSLSLVTFNAVKNVYDVHPAVQEWARTTIPGSSHNNSAALLALSISYEQPIEGYTRQEDLMLHVYEILKLHPSPNPNDAWQFIVMYNEIGQRHGTLEIQVAEARVNSLGLEHPDTLESMKNLADMYREHGNLKGVEDMSIRILPAQIKILGMEHPDTICSLKTLVEVDRPDELKGLGIIARLSDLKEFKEDPHRLLHTIAKLVVLCHQQDQPLSTLVLEEAALAICTQHLGDNHPDTLRTSTALATTYQVLGRQADADALRSKVLESCKQVALTVDSLPMLRTMGNLGAIYQKQSHFIYARDLRTVVTDAATRLLGESHPTTLQSKACLAASYYELGELSEAEALQETVLADRKRILGGSHLDTLQSMDDLAATYYEQGHLERSKSLVLQVLATREQVLSEDSVVALRTKVRLAEIYREQGRASEAEILIAGAIKTQVHVLGANHPDSLKSMANMATIYCRQGRFDAAESLETDVLETQRQMLGYGHPDTLRSMLGLAAIYYARGQTKESEMLETEVLAAHRNLYGSEHPKTTLSRNSLLDRYYSNGRLAETEDLKVAILAARVRKLGWEHDHTISSMRDLAATYNNQSRLVETEKLRLHVLTLCEKKFGKDHPDTLSSMAELAATYRKQKRLAEAEDLMLRVLVAQRQFFGQDDPKTLSSTEDLATMYYEQGRAMVAEELAIQVLDIRQRLLGDEHPNTVQSMVDLVTRYYRPGQLPELEEVKRMVLSARSRVLGSSHVETLRSMADLAALYYSRGEWVEAEELLIQILAGWRQGLGETLPKTIKGMEDLVSTYIKQDRFIELELLMVHLLAIERQVLGDEHPDTLRRIMAMAATCESKGRLLETTELQAKVLVAREILLGRGQPAAFSGREGSASIESKASQYSLSANHGFDGERPENSLVVGDSQSD